jgi:hypothetical protein
MNSVSTASTGTGTTRFTRLLHGDIEYLFPDGSLAETAIALGPHIRHTSTKKGIDHDRHPQRISLEFGKAREAVALFKEGIAIQKRVGAGLDFSTRLLTDVTGPFYTVVLEITVPNLAAFEGDAPRLMGDKDWQANYQKIAPLVESGYREVFTLLE